MFDAQRFIAECDAAILGGQGAAAIRGLLAAAIADPAAIIAALGEPTRAGVEVLHRSPRLTVLNLAYMAGGETTSSGAVARPMRAGRSRLSVRHPC